MKRNLLIFVILLFSFAVNAQQIETEFPVEPDAKVEIDLNQMKSYVDAGWFVPAWDLLDFYFAGNHAGYVTHYANLIFPDSIVRYEGSSGTISYSWLTAVGQDLDPVSPMYSNVLSTFQDYKVDSLFVLAWYNVVNSSVVDTLIAEFVVGTPLTSPHFAHSIYVYPPDTLRVSPPRMLGDTTQKGYFSKLTAPDKIIVKYPLTMADSTLQNGKYIQFPVGIEVPAGNIIGVSLSFVPGNNYNFDDVLYSYMQGGALTQQLNAFRVGLYSVDNTTDNPSLFFDPFYRYNLNCYIHKSGRYKLYADQWRNERMASLITWGFDLGWKVSAQDNVGISEHDDDPAIFYPNPVSEVLTVEPKEGVSSVKIFSAQGQLVYSSANVKDLLHIDVSAWSKGMYVAEVVSGMNVSKKKLIVH